MPKRATKAKASTKDNEGEMSMLQSDADVVNQTLLSLYAAMSAKSHDQECCIQEQRMKIQSMEVTLYESNAKIDDLKIRLSKKPSEVHWSRRVIALECMVLVMVLAFFFMVIRAW